MLSYHLKAVNRCLPACVPLFADGWRAEMPWFYRHLSAFLTLCATFSPSSVLSGLAGKRRQALADTHSRQRFFLRICSGHNARVLMGHWLKPANSEGARWVGQETGDFPVAKCVGNPDNLSLPNAPLCLNMKCKHLHKRGCPDNPSRVTRQCSEWFHSRSWWSSCGIRPIWASRQDGHYWPGTGR